MAMGVATTPSVATGMAVGIGEMFMMWLARPILNCHQAAVAYEQHEPKSYKP
jgi:hypothetical protein